MVRRKPSSLAWIPSTKVNEPKRTFSYPLAEEITSVFQKHEVDFLFIGKSGAIIIGYPDTTQDADLYVKKDEANGRRAVAALREIGFAVDDMSAKDIIRGKDFIQLRNGPFDLDLIFAPDGIERYEDAQERALLIEGMPVCHIDDIIASKRAAGREKDLESLGRLEEFSVWVQENWTHSKSHPPRLVDRVMHRVEKFVDACPSAPNETDALEVLPAEESKSECGDNSKTPAEKPMLPGTLQVPPAENQGGKPRQ